MMKSNSIGEKSQKTYALFSRAMSFFLLHGIFLICYSQIHALGGAQIFTSSDFVISTSKNYHSNAQVGIRTNEKKYLVAKKKRKYSIKDEVQISKRLKIHIQKFKNYLKIVPGTSQLSSESIFIRDAKFLISQNYSDEITVYELGNSTALFATSNSRYYSYSQFRDQIGCTYSIRPPPMIF